MSGSAWDFAAIKTRIEAIADRARDGTECDAPIKYHKGLETELKALRAWIDVDERERGPREIAELREIVDSLEHRVSDLASTTDQRTSEPTRTGGSTTWRQ